MLDNKTLSKIAKMYYLESMTQKQIGDNLGLSRIAISRALKRCIDEGIVEIKIKEYESYEDVEKRLKEKYQNKLFKVVPYSSDSIKQLDLLSIGAEEILPDIIDKSDNIGVGWGKTLSKLSLKSNKKYPEKTFVSMIGGYGNVPYELHSNQITSKLSETFNAKSKLLLTPTIIEEKSLKENILKERSIKEVFDMYDKLDCAIVSIGNPLDNSATNMYRSGYYKPNDISQLEKEDICCDILSSVFLDRTGKERHIAILDRTINISAKDYKKIPRKIAVSGGEDKLFSIYLSLENGYIDYLVTDENTANYLLNK